MVEQVQQELYYFFTQSVLGMHRLYTDALATVLAGAVYPACLPVSSAHSGGAACVGLI